MQEVIWGARSGLMIRDELITHDLYHVFSNSAQQAANTHNGAFEILDVVDDELMLVIDYFNSHPTQGN